MAREIIEVIIPADTDGLAEGTVNKYDTGVPPADLDALPDGAARFAAAEAGATADQTGLEMQTDIVGLADADRVLIGSEPLSGEKKIYGIHRNAAGSLELDSEDTAEV